MVKAAIVLAMLALGGSPADDATTTLLQKFYAGSGMWRVCDRADCPQTNSDWGVDSLTYALWLRWQMSRDPAVPPVMRELETTAPMYGLPCTRGCGSWSDNPLWDAIAAARMYQVTGDDLALAKARAAFDFIVGSNAYTLGACPDIRYQQAYGQDNQLKTLETDSNAIKAALLLREITGEQHYLDFAVTTYAAVRARFLDPKLALYTVYVFDDGKSCTQVPRRFFASVNGNMIWNGLELAKETGQASYRTEAAETGRAIALLDDSAGVFADLQAENDVVEPLVEAMVELGNRPWLETNARAAGETYGRLFDGPAPATTITAWQANGALALGIAAPAVKPSRPRWGKRVNRELGVGSVVRFTGSAIAFYGTLGEVCCEPGHARVYVDGNETLDGTGIWQNKSSSGRAITNTVLFAWRWKKPGRHTIRFAAGVQNGKEGGAFLHLTGYRLEGYAAG